MNQLKSLLAKLVPAPLVYSIEQAMHSIVRESTISTPAIASDIGYYLMMMSVALNKQWRFVNCFEIYILFKLGFKWYEFEELKDN